MVKIYNPVFLNPAISKHNQFLNVNVTGRSIANAAIQVNEGLTNHGEGIARAGQGVGLGMTNHGVELRRGLVISSEALSLAARYIADRGAIVATNGLITSNRAISTLDNALVTLDSISGTYAGIAKDIVKHLSKVKEEVKTGTTILSADMKLHVNQLSLACQGLGENLERGTNNIGNSIATLSKSIEILSEDLKEASSKFGEFFGYQAVRVAVIGFVVYQFLLLLLFSHNRMSVFSGIGIATAGLYSMIVYYIPQHFTLWCLLILMSFVYYQATVVAALKTELLDMKSAINREITAHRDPEQVQPPPPTTTLATTSALAAVEYMTCEECREMLLTFANLELNQYIDRRIVVFS